MVRVVRSVMHGLGPGFERSFGIHQAFACLGDERETAGGERRILAIPDGAFQDLEERLSALPTALGGEETGQRLGGVYESGIGDERGLQIVNGVLRVV